MDIRVLLQLLVLPSLESDSISRRLAVFSNGYAICILTSVLGTFFDQDSYSIGCNTINYKL